MISPKVEPAKVPSQVCLMPEPVVKTLWSVILWLIPSSKTLEESKSGPLGLLGESWRLAFSASRTWILLVSLTFLATDGDCCSVGSRGGMGKAFQEGGNPLTTPPPPCQPLPWGGLLWLYFFPGAISVLGTEPPPRYCDPASPVSLLPAAMVPSMPSSGGVLNPLRTSLGIPDLIRREAASVGVSSLAG